MMTEIKKEVQVAASQATCFEVFTQQMDAWWPKAYHIGACPMRNAVLEARPDGRWYSTHADGSEVNIGKVLTWSPYELLVLAWQIDGNFQYDEKLITEVEVQFIAEGPQNTLVKFAHKHLDRLAGGEKVIEGMDEGWGTIMQLYKGVVTKDYKTSIEVNGTCDQALAAIADVSAWWAKDFKGAATKAGDRFTVRFGETFVDFEIAHPTPHEVTWLVTDCYLPWLKHKTEWNGTRVIWQVNETDHGSRIDMMHIGLSPQAECFESCRKGWNEHVNESLLNLMNSGKGGPQ
jgi:hypothetical protein